MNAVFFNKVNTLIISLIIVIIGIFCVAARDRENAFLLI